MSVVLVKILRPCRADGQSWAEGDVAEISRDVAETLLLLGKAEPAERPRPKVAAKAPDKRRRRK